MKGDDPEIDTAQNPKCFDGRLARLDKIRKTFTDSIPKKGGGAMMLKNGLLENYKRVNYYSC